MRKPQSKSERTRFAEDGRITSEAINGNLAVFLGGTSALMGTVDGLGCREDLQKDQLLAEYNVRLIVGDAFPGG